MGFLSFSHNRQFDVGGPAKTIRTMHQFNRIMDVYPKSSGHFVSIRRSVGADLFDILVSHRLFSPASRCGRCPFLGEVLYGIHVVAIH